MSQTRPKNRKKIVLVDADAFIALVKPDDSNHAKALAILKSLSPEYYAYTATNYVLAEVCTVLSQKVGHEIALAYYQILRSAERGMTIIQADQALDEDAIVVFGNQKSKNTSFINCVNIAIIKSGKADLIFSFDAVYKKNGCMTVEELLAKAN